jgi:hypothetical protein
MPWRHRGKPLSLESLDLGSNPTNVTMSEKIEEEVVPVTVTAILAKSFQRKHLKEKSCCPE